MSVNASLPVLIDKNITGDAGAQVSPAGRAVITWGRDASTERSLAGLLDLSEARALPDFTEEEIEQLVRGAFCFVSVSYLSLTHEVAGASPSELESSQTLPSEDT